MKVQLFLNINNSISNEYNFSSEYVRIITDVSEQILRDIKDFYGEAITYLKFLPITSYLKEKFDQVKMRM